MATLLTELNTFRDSFKSNWSRLAPYFRTIRFKLAFLYSGILYIFTGSLVLGFNLFLGTSLHRDPEPKVVQFYPFGASDVVLFEDFSQLRSEERQRIRNIRLNDLRRVQQMSIIALIPLAGLSFIAGYYLSGKFLDPLTRLKRDIEKLDSKDLGIHISPDTDDEVGALIGSFNEMSSRLKTAFNTQEQFVQNASHELRTPLTIIQTNLDTAIDDKKASKKEMAQAISKALLGVNQLRKLVNYLLELTTVHPTDLTKININEIIKTQAAAFKDIATEKGLKFDIKYGKSLNNKVTGDFTLLSRMFANLLENAVKYSNPVPGKETLISVRITYFRHNCQVTIANYGDTIPAEKITRLFDRFYQVEPSRNKKLGGYGLGLAIALKIIQEHKGHINVRSEEGKTVFTVKLPLN